MAELDDIGVRLAALHCEIEELSAARLRSGRRNYYAAYMLLILTIVSSAGAGIASFLNQSPDLVGVLAFVPGVLALSMSQLKLQARSNWHYQMSHLLKDLLNKIKYQTPTNPSSEQLVGLAAEFSRINLTMEGRWVESLGLEVGDARRQQPL